MKICLNIQKIYRDEGHRNKEACELIDRNFFDIAKKSACFISWVRGKTGI